MAPRKRFALNVPIEVEEKPSHFSRTAWILIGMWGALYAAATIMGVN